VRATLEANNGVDANTTCSVESTTKTNRLSAEKIAAIANLETLLGSRKATPTGNNDTNELIISFNLTADGKRAPHSPPRVPLSTSLNDLDIPVPPTAPPMFESEICECSDPNCALEKLTMQHEIERLKQLLNATG